MATTEPPSRGNQSSIAAAVRVVPSLAASSGVDGSQSVQINVVVRGQSGARDPFGHHARIAEDRRAGPKRVARGFGSARREDEIAGGLDHAAGVDDPHGDPLFNAARSAQGRPRRE